MVWHNLQIYSFIIYQTNLISLKNGAMRDAKRCGEWKRDQRPWAGIFCWLMKDMNYEVHIICSSHYLNPNSQLVIAAASTSNLDHPGHGWSKLHSPLSPSIPIVTVSLLLWWWNWEGGGEPKRELRSRAEETAAVSSPKKPLPLPHSGRCWRAIRCSNMSELADAAVVLPFVVTRS